MIFALVNCGNKGGDAKDNAQSGNGDKKIKIVTTTTMLADLSRIIGGDKVEVEGLMGEGVDPHLYTASAGDVDKLSKADLIVYGDFRLLEEEDPDLFIYERHLDGKALLCVCNVSEKEREYTVPAEFQNGQVLIQNMPDRDVHAGKLAPYEAYVLAVE